MLQTFGHPLCGQLTSPIALFLAIVLPPGHKHHARLVAHQREPLELRRMSLDAVVRPELHRRELPNLALNIDDPGIDYWEQCRERSDRYPRRLAIFRNFRPESLCRRWFRRCFTHKTSFLHCRNTFSSRPTTGIDPPPRRTQQPTPLAEIRAVQLLTRVQGRTRPDRVLYSSLLYKLHFLEWLAIG